MRFCCCIAAAVVFGQVATSQDLGLWTTIQTSTNTEDSQDVRKGWGRMAIHLVLLPDKRLLVFNRSRTSPSTAFVPALISSSSGSNPYLYDRFTEVPMPEPEENHEIFCAGHTLMEDGTPFFAGGHLHHDNNGLNELFRFVSDDWALSSLTMTHGRWYPTVVHLPNRRMMVFAGTYLSNPNDPDSTVLVNDTPSLWGYGFPDAQNPDKLATLAAHTTNAYYPFIFVNPLDGSLFYSRRGSNVTADERMDLTTLAWSNVASYGDPVIANVTDVYPSAAMLIRQALVGGQVVVDKAVVLKCGGGVVRANQRARRDHRFGEPYPPPQLVGFITHVDAIVQRHEQDEALPHAHRAARRQGAGDGWRQKRSIHDRQRD